MNENENKLLQFQKYLPLIAIGAIIFGAYKFSIYLFLYIYLRTIGATWLISELETGNFYSLSFTFIATIILATVFSLLYLPIETKNKTEFDKKIMKKLNATKKFVAIIIVFAYLLIYFRINLFFSLLFGLQILILLCFSIFLIVGLVDFPYSLIKFKFNLLNIKQIFVLLLSPFLTICILGNLKGQMDLVKTSTDLPSINIKGSGDAKNYAVILTKNQKVYAIILDTLPSHVKLTTDFFRPSIKPNKKVYVFSLDTIS